MFKIISWNANGLRSLARQGFSEWLSKCEADVVALQEVRALPEQLPEEVRSPQGWHPVFFPAERAGYSGVAIYTRQEPDEVHTTLESRFDCEGRLIFARFGSLWLVNGYFPNGQGKNRDNSRIPYKLDFYRALFDKLEPQRRDGKRVVVVGDFNTAHEEIDIARPKENQKTSGFRPEERAEFRRWIDAGWNDTFRHSIKDGGHYTWWSQRPGVRARNVGWRIDYALASHGAMSLVKKAQIHADVFGSDHCPISVELDKSALRG